MPKLYIEEYKNVLGGSRILIACREAILRENIKNVLSDIRFMDRLGIQTILLHNLANRFSNRKYFSYLQQKLPNTQICRIPVEAGEDFYDYALNFKSHIDKIVFVERKYLTDHKGRKLNALTTKNALRLIREKKIVAYGDLIANTNFKAIIEKICTKIEDKQIDRIHIVPARKHCLKHELFSLEGTGTLIANNFIETLESIDSDNQVRIVEDILKPYISKGLIKPRGREHIWESRKNFYLAKIDGIPVGCVEKINLSGNTVELGALAVATRYRNHQVGLFLIRSFVDIVAKEGYRRVISLTKNPKLKNIYLAVGFTEKTPEDLIGRQSKSPSVPMFVYLL
jgi:N-acetylglutamate synthase-like GNAT family acetyltransferase